MYVAPTTPQSIGGVLDGGFSLYRATLGKVFSIALIAALFSSLWTPFFRAQIQAEAPSIAIIIGLPLIGIIVSIVIYSTVVARIDSIARGETANMAAALNIGWRRSPASFGASFLASLIIFAGFMLLIVPGIYLSGMLMFVGFAAVVERKSPTASLSRSWELVRGSWWRSAVTLTIIFIIMMVAYVLVGTVAGIAGAASAITAVNTGATVVASTPWYLTYVIGPLLDALLIPFMCAMLMAVYYDLKLRNEGSDLAERIPAIEA